ncbi:rab11 family-interacting protein 3 isoform X1 [Alosa pseudoharengus]|uniref:rab11 family-interacting protein 3 isoform X1 n=1 Tax=Alosa pseudoharengus TaxID=34774 RepID=UPI003F8C3B73
MEQILMSSPGSHTDWDGDQSSLGFMLLDSNDPVTPCGNEETEKRQLHFEEGDRNVMSLSLGEIFSENALNLDDLFRTPQYSGVEQVFPWEQDAEPPASHWESQLSCSQNIPPSEHGEHLEESASPCSNASPAITSSVQQWAEDTTDILESPRVCTVSLIAGDSTGDVEQEQGVDTHTHTPLCPQTLIHTSAQDPQHVYTPEEHTMTHRTPQLDHTLTGVCLEPTAPPNQTSTPLVCEEVDLLRVCSEQHTPQFSLEEDAFQQTQQQISEFRSSCLSPADTLLTEASEYTGQTFASENMTESEICQQTHGSSDGDIMLCEGGIELLVQTKADISHHTETEGTNALTLLSSPTNVLTLLSSPEEEIVTDQTSHSNILNVLTDGDLGCELATQQLCKGDHLSVLITEIHTSEHLLEDTVQQVLPEQTPKEEASLDNKPVEEMPESVSKGIILIEGDLLSEAVSEYTTETELHEQVGQHAEEICEGDVLSNETPDKSISENSAEKHIKQKDALSEFTSKPESYQHLHEGIIAEHTPEEDILPGWIFEVNPSETEMSKPLAERVDLSDLLLESEGYRHTLEVDMSSEHVPGAETSEDSVQHTPNGDASAVMDLQHILLADGFPEQTEVVDVFPKDVIEAGSSPNSSSIAEINPSEERGTLDFEDSDTVPTILDENTQRHMFSLENIEDDILASANSESIEDTTTLQLNNLDTTDSPEVDNSSKSPEFNAQNLGDTDILNLENSQTNGTDRTDTLSSEISHNTEDQCITHTLNIEVADDSHTFSTNPPDNLHTPDAENTSELDTTCPDQQFVEGCDSCVEPMSDGISTQPQEKSCTLNPPESSSENTPAPDSCPPDTQSGSISVCAVDQNATLTPGGLPLLTCAGDQLSDVGGALGEACSANQTPAQLEGHQGEGEALTLTQASPEQVTQAQRHGSSPAEGTTQQLMEVKDELLLPDYGSLDPDPLASVEVPSPGPISVAMASMEPLRAVFQALDQDGDGFVRMEEFLEFAAAYGAEQVKDLTRFLDPSGLGVISFEDFHRGITAISNGGSEPDLYRLELNATDARLPAEEYDEQAEVSDSVYLGSESAYSECETFTDEDTGALAPPELHEDVETDSGIENTLTEGDDHRNRFSLGADIHGHALSAVIGGEEEHFEDFGESNTSDLLLANHEEERPGPEDAGDPEPHPHPGSPKRCPPVLSPSSGKRLSSKKAARLLQNSALGLEGMGDLSHGLLDLTDTDITDKMLLLERRVCELEQDSVLSEEQHSRLRQENLTLVHRANALEEQLKEQELRADDTLHTHTRKHRDAMAKLQRERDLEIENLQARLQQLDEENSELRSCVPCLRANIERLEEEKRKLQDEVEDMSERLNEELDSRRKMTDKLSHERHNNQKEKECMQELIEDLRKQLEHLQLFKLEMEAKRGRSPSAGLQEYNTRTREHELEQEIRRLKQDNRSLKEQNDELNGQIINLSIQGAKSLVSESFSESLAAEINSVSRSELMEAIHKQKEINFRLQDYIDRIIVAIMESNPSILEVK